MILVSGGTGLLGSHLLYKLIKENNIVKAIKRPTSNLNNVLKVFYYYDNNAKDIFDKIEWCELDILDADEVNNCMKGITLVYHTAAIVSFVGSEKEQMIKNNVIGTANMVNAALENNIKKFCHVSSIAALGNSDNIIDEKTFRNPNSSYSGYSISKYLSELEVWRAVSEGLNAVIVNPSIILGLCNSQTGSSSIFYNIWKGMKFYTKGGSGYVDVEDVVKIMMLLMDSNINNERFIVSAENIEYKKVFNKIAEKLYVKKPYIYANKFLLTFAWVFELFLQKISNRKPIITKEIANSAQSLSKYSNQKIIDELNYKFISIDESINKNSELFMKEFKNK